MQDLSCPKAVNVYIFDCSRNFPNTLISTLTNSDNHQALLLTANLPVYLLPFTPVFLHLLRYNTALSLSRYPNYLPSADCLMRQSAKLSTHLHNIKFRQQENYFLCKTFTFNLPNVSTSCVLCGLYGKCLIDHTIHTYVYT